MAAALFYSDNLLDFKRMQINNRSNDVRPVGMVHNRLLSNKTKKIYILFKTLKEFMPWRRRNRFLNRSRKLSVQESLLLVTDHTRNTPGSQSRVGCIVYSKPGLRNIFSLVLNPLTKIQSPLYLQSKKLCSPVY